MSGPPFESPEHESDYYREMEAHARHANEDPPGEWLPAAARLDILLALEAAKQFVGWPAGRTNQMAVETLIERALTHIR